MICIDIITLMKIIFKILIYKFLIFYNRYVMICTINYDFNDYGNIINNLNTHIYIHFLISYLNVI